MMVSPKLSDVLRQAPPCPTVANKQRGAWNYEWPAIYVTHTLLKGERKGHSRTWGVALGSFLPPHLPRAPPGVPLASPSKIPALEAGDPGAATLLPLQPAERGACQVPPGEAFFKSKCSIKTGAKGQNTCGFSREAEGKPSHRNYKEGNICSLLASSDYLIRAAGWFISLPDDKDLRSLASHLV